MPQDIEFFEITLFLAIILSVIVIAWRYRYKIRRWWSELYVMNSREKRDLDLLVRELPQIHELGAHRAIEQLGKENCFGYRSGNVEYKNVEITYRVHKRDLDLNETFEAKVQRCSRLSLIFTDGQFTSYEIDSAPIERAPVVTELQKHSIDAFCESVRRVFPLHTVHQK